MVQRVFVRAFATFRNPVFLLPALAVSVAVTLLTRAVSLTEFPHIADLSPSAVLFNFGRVLMPLLIGILATWPSASVLALGIAVSRGKSASFLERWVPTVVFIRLALVQLVLGLATAVGILLLIVPGVFAAVVWSQVSALMVDGKAEFFDAREASQDLTDGMRGEIFMVLLCELFIGAIAFGCSVVLKQALGVPMNAWSVVIVSLAWHGPVTAFLMAVSAALYIEVLAGAKSLTPAEFYLATPAADPAH